MGCYFRGHWMPYGRYITEQGPARGKPRRKPYRVTIPKHTPQFFEELKDALHYRDGECAKLGLDPMCGDDIRVASDNRPRPNKKFKDLPRGISRIEVPHEGLEGAIRYVYLRAHFRGEYERIKLDGTISQEDAVKRLLDWREEKMSATTK